MNIASDRAAVNPISHHPFINIPNLSNCDIDTYISVSIAKLSPELILFIMHVLHNLKQTF